jgi:hypothetical protein
VDGEIHCGGGRRHAGSSAVQPAAASGLAAVAAAAGGARTTTVRGEQRTIRAAADADATIVSVTVPETGLGSVGTDGRSARHDSTGSTAEVAAVDIDDDSCCCETAEGSCSAPTEVTPPTAHANGPRAPAATQART